MRRHFALLFVLALFAAACGGGSDDTAADTDAGTGGADEAEPEQTEAEKQLWNKIEELF